MAEMYPEAASWQPAMEQVSAVITGSVLGQPGTVFIDNPWPALQLLASDGIGKTAQDWHPPGWKLTGPPPKLAKDTCNYVPNVMNSVTQLNYIRDGLSKFTDPTKKAFYGVCNDFAWIVTSVLVTAKFTGARWGKQKALLPSGTRVELYGIIGNQPDKHLFTVVNRAADSTAGDYTTWGADCFVVDQWYALQTVTNPVKTLTAGPFYDPVFIGWWNATVPGSMKSPNVLANSFKPQLDFHAGDYPAANPK